MELRPATRERAQGPSIQSEVCKLLTLPPSPIIYTHITAVAFKSPTSHTNTSHLVNSGWMSISNSWDTMSFISNWPCLLSHRGTHNEKKRAKQSVLLYSPKQSSCLCQFALIRSIYSALLQEYTKPTAWSPTHFAPNTIISTQRDLSSTYVLWREFATCFLARSNLSISW